MRRQIRVWFVGAVGLFMATAAGMSTARAQETARPAGTGAAAGSSASQVTELLVAHALCMALEGTELQLMIRQAGGPVMASKTDAGVARTSTPDGTAPATAEKGRGDLMQLQQHVRRSFQGSYELMKASNRQLRAGAEARSQLASASRLYAAANLYANTLYSLGRQTFGWEAGWEPIDRAEGHDHGQSRRPGQTQERGAESTATAGGAKLTTAEIATITLINHSVKESLGAFELNLSLRGMDAADAGAQRLREHARAMAAEGRQSVEQIIASLREKEGASPRGGDSGSRAQHGWSGTQTQALAQQAREVIRVLDELGGR